MADLEAYFRRFRDGIVGEGATFRTPYGEVPLLYADWIASGRLYRPIEDRMVELFGPFVGNTHSEASETGVRMTRAYHHAQRRIKEHVGAGPDDLIITAGSGMTGMVNKLQRILGLRGCGLLREQECLKEIQRPVVFVTHMEHHSNHTSWYETICDVVVLKPGPGLQIDAEELGRQLVRYQDRAVKIGAFTACSNVTGIRTPYRELARIMHEAGGLCFVDLAASAPYDPIDMHPEDPLEALDAIYFSPHKFLGGPGSSGVLVFHRSLYKNKAPDDPGGGTVDWTNPWGGYKYVDDIEAREDGGTPAFLQTMRAALAVDLKEQMGPEAMREREAELLAVAFEELGRIPRLHVLAGEVQDRLGVLSFYFDDVHYNLAVRLLNDRFGIQVRGGCVCAGTYGHYLLHLPLCRSLEITDRISAGDLSEKPGWVRWSLHPTTTVAEVRRVCDALRQIEASAGKWAEDYAYDEGANEFAHRAGGPSPDVASWFRLPLPEARGDR